MLNQNNNNPIHSIELLLTQQNNQLILPNQNSIINRMMNIRNHSINSNVKFIQLKQ